MTTPAPFVSPIIFSTSEDYFHAAQQELGEAFGSGSKFERLGRDTGRMVAAGIDIARVAAACRERPLVFIRHLMQEAISVPSGEVAETMEGIAARAGDLVRAQHGTAPIALQVWASEGTTRFRYRPDELRRVVAAALTEAGCTVTRGGQPHVLSICLTPQRVILGLNRTEDALTDWPGGRVGLAKGEEQISRAEFKLEELFQVFDVALPTTGVALDLGASPGGWTHLLRGRGLTVWAVDPANLDERLAYDAGVHHAQTTAATFLAETRERFDLVVNDMRMVPDLSCQMMVHAARRLKPGGLAIVTLKLFRHDALASVHRALAVLEQAYDIVHARQLSHNRHEVTVVARRQP